MTIASATRRLRNTKGSSFLTHGADDHDHRARNKARRQMDQAVIAEQLEEDIPAGINPASPAEFRIVLWTQVYENYGAHCCECKDECTCPAHWKAKGGSEYHIPVGDANAVIDLGSYGINKLVEKATAKIDKCDNHWHEWVIGWEIVPNTEKTEEERLIDWTYENGLRFDASQEEKDQWRDQRLANLVIEVN